MINQFKIIAMPNTAPRVHCFVTHQSVECANMTDARLLMKMAYASGDLIAALDWLEE